VTLIDFWHEHILAIRRDGLELTGMTEAERVVVKPRTMLLHEVSGLAKQQPVDIAFVSVKSCDTEWMAAMIRDYLARVDSWSRSRTASTRSGSRASSAGAAPWAASRRG
jgi:hypothetical protein